MSEPEPEHGPEGPEPEPAPHGSPWPSSSSAVLENDDLLTMILRRLPPRPSSLPRASLVDKRWRGFVTSTNFPSDFRAFHGAAPVLGSFHNTNLGSPDHRFVFTVDPPDRVPASLFRVPFGRDHRRRWFLDCRHGRALLLGMVNPSRDVLVWDPMTGERHRAHLPVDAGDVHHGAVLCSCGHERDCQSSHFQVILVWFKLRPPCSWHAFAAVYSSESGTWSRTIPMMVPFVLGTA